MNTSRPSGRSSRAASEIHRYGSHHADAPYSLITTSAQPTPSGAALGVRLDQREVPAELILQAARGGQLPGRDVHPGRARAAAGQPRRDIPAAAAELHCRRASQHGRQDRQPRLGKASYSPVGLGGRHRERADRSNQGGRCSSHCRRVTGTCLRAFCITQRSQDPVNAHERAVRLRPVSTATDARMAGEGSVESRW
jgi:hypothetical protein